MESIYRKVKEILEKKTNLKVELNISDEAYLYFYKDNDIKYLINLTKLSRGTFVIDSKILSDLIILFN